MTDTFKAPLVGQNDNAGCCTWLCWRRAFFGIKIDHLEDSGEKLIRISIVAETFRALFYWSLSEIQVCQNRNVNALGNKRTTTVT